MLKVQANPLLKKTENKKQNKQKKLKHVLVNWIVGILSLHTQTLMHTHKHTHIHIKPPQCAV